MNRSFARKFNLRNGTTRRTKEPTTKSDLGQTTYCQSLAEALEARRLELNRDVEKFHEQREKRVYELNGSYRIAYPDFKVWYRNGLIEIVEVKNETAQYDPEFLEKADALMRSYAVDDLSYRVVYSDALYRQPGRRNVELLLWARNLTIPTTMEDAVVDAVLEGGSITIDELVDLANTNFQTVLALCGKGRLFIDVDEFIDGDAIVTP